MKTLVQIKKRLIFIDLMSHGLDKQVMWMEQCDSPQFFAYETAFLSHKTLASYCAMGPGSRIMDLEKTTTFVCTVKVILTGIAD